MLSNGNIWHQNSMWSLFSGQGFSTFKLLPVSTLILNTYAWKLHYIHVTLKKLPKHRKKKGKRRQELNHTNKIAVLTCKYESNKCGQILSSQCKLNLCTATPFFAALEAPKAQATFQSINCIICEVIKNASVCLSMSKLYLCPDKCAIKRKGNQLKRCFKLMPYRLVSTETAASFYFVTFYGRFQV